MSGETDESISAAVKLDDPLRTGALVQTVYILCDDRIEAIHRLQLRERSVPGIWTAPRDNVPQLAKHFPDTGGIFPESIDVGVLHGIISIPKPLGAAEGRDIAVDADARSRKGDGVGRSGEKFHRAIQIRKSMAHRAATAIIPSILGTPIFSVKAPAA